MEPTLLHPLPRRGAVLREQLRTVGLSLRRGALLAAGALGALSAWILALWLDEHGHGSRIHLVPDALSPAVLVALFAALFAWKGEDPARRGYHWSMPVGHAEHAMAKSFAGWAWVMAAIGGYVAWLGVMAFLTGGDIGVAASWGRHERSMEAFAGWRWLVPIVGATILYLLGTALALASPHPWRWLAGGAVGFVFVLALDDDTLLPGLVHAMWSGEHGLHTALTGVLPDPFVYGVNGPFYERSWEPRPSFTAWTAAAPLWLAISLGVATLAARRQPRGG